MTVDAGAEPTPPELEPIGPSASLGALELQPREAEATPQMGRPTPDQTATAEPLVASAVDDAVTSTIEADGGVTDLREAERTAEAQREPGAHADAGAVAPPATERPESARPVTGVQKPVPDVEIPDWLRTDPDRRALRAEPESVRHPQPPIPPVSTTIETDEVVLKPFADDTPARGSDAFSVLPPPAPEAPGHDYATVLTSRTSDAPPAPEAAHEEEFAEPVQLGQSADATMDSIPADEPVTWEEPQLTGPAEDWEGEEPPIAPDASVYAGDDVFDWASSATQSVHPVDPAEGLAEALETVAQRLRRGELQVPFYRPGMSDAAALTAALASVLGIRR